MNTDIVRFWKDARYRQSLSVQERALLPENPVGEVELVELTEAELFEVTGTHLLYVSLSGTNFCPTVNVGPCSTKSI